MSDPSLGVAIPSFRQPDFVGQSIKSLRQCTVPFRAIIQDGVSDAGTIRAIREAVDGDERFELVVESDAGQSDAINRAWLRLLDSHDFVTWLNTDDVVYPNGLARLVEALSADPRAVVVYGDLDAIDTEGRVVGWTRAPNRVKRFRLVYHHNLVPGILPVIRSSSIRDVGMLDTSLHYAMDHDLFIRLAAVGEIRRVPVAVAGYRTYADAKTWGNKAESEAEIATVRARYRELPLLTAKAVRSLLRLAWYPTRRRYTRGVMRLANRDFGVRAAPTR